MTTGKAALTTQGDGSLWDVLVEALSDQGRVTFQVYRQASGPYCTVRGLGVDASGYKTVAEAFVAWMEARAFDVERRANA